jgi:hypothetical protein
MYQHRFSDILASSFSLFVGFIRYFSQIALLSVGNCFRTGATRDGKSAKCTALSLKTTKNIKIIGA